MCILGHYIGIVTSMNERCTYARGKVLVAIIHFKYETQHMTTVSIVSMREMVGNLCWGYGWYYCKLRHISERQTNFIVVQKQT